MFAMGPAFFNSAAGSYATLTLAGTYPAATVGTPYSQTLAIAGGLSPYSLTGGTGIASGSLPAGLSLSIVGSTLVLSGTPTTAATATFTASVGSTDSQVATSPQSIVVSPALTYATWNPSDKGTLILLTLGNRNEENTTSNGSVAWNMVRSTLSRSTGKAYAEATMSVDTNHFSGNFGVATSAANKASYVGSDAFGWGLQIGNGVGTNGIAHSAALTPSGLANQATGTIVGIAVDFSAGKAWFRVGSTWILSGDPVAGTNPSFTFTAGSTFFLAGGSPFRLTDIFVNAGQSSFSQTPPTGFTDRWAV